MIFVIEHLEPKLYKWCILEYKHISSFIGKEKLWITNLKNSSKLLNCTRTFRKSVSKMDLNKVCVLDPEASRELISEDAKKFDYLVFGGILGDYPPKKRTKEELKLNCERRNLGKEQMATDNAVYVAKEILSGKKLNDLKFKDGFELYIKEGESMQLPYKYVIVNGKHLICDALIEMLKKQEEF